MKYEILRVLREKSSGFISGEALSNHFGVSRTSIWKHINELIADGYQIDASTKKGYKYISSPESFNSFELSYKLETEIIGRKILYFDVLDSTSDYAKGIAAKGCEDGLTVVAGMQTAGRGRRGNNWDSVLSGGIYLSVVLKPSILPEEIQIITIAASVAVAEAIEIATGIRPGIKWPNDLILDGKKVCGILTEMNSEMDRVNYIVLGIGINFSQKVSEFNTEIKDKAISLMSYAENNMLSVKGWSKLDLIQAVLKGLDRVYKERGHTSNYRIEECPQMDESRHTEKAEVRDIIERWKSYSITIGREVRYISKDGEFTGKAVDITNDGRLIVLNSEGNKKEVVSGEVSVRGVLGYI